MPEPELNAHYDHIANRKVLFAEKALRTLVKRVSAAKTTKKKEN